jgi:hypothetical protein
METVIFLQKLLVCFLVIGIPDDTVHGTDGGTLGFVVGPQTLGAKMCIDDIDGIALTDGIIWTIGGTGVACDALLADHQGHLVSPCASRDSM